MRTGNGLPLGYSKIEVAFILLLFAFVGVFAITKYLDLTTIAKESVEAGVIAGVRQGLSSYAVKPGDGEGASVYPPVLDEANLGNATSHNLFFANVLKKGIAVSGWAKTGKNEYLTPKGERYGYDPETGSFHMVASMTIKTPSHLSQPDSPNR